MLERLKRAVHFDFHTMPGIDNFGENFDAARFARQLKDAHVAYINMFARCNIGFSYYPTKVGTPYPGMKGNMLGDTVRECHKLGIGVTGYVNVGLNHEKLRTRLDWARMEKDGSVYNMKRGANWFRMPCFNSGYADYVLEEIREVLAEGVDGIFCDIMCPRDCCCPRCIEGMREMGMDYTKDEDISRFAMMQSIKMGKRIRAVVPEDKYLFLNSISFDACREMNSHIEIECLPSCWSYDFFWASVAFARTVNPNIVYMNGRFQTEWGDFGGYKGRASVENDFFDAVMNGVGTSLGDHLHPAELAEEAIYRDLGEIYARIEATEPYTDGARFVSEIGVLTGDGVIGNAYHGLSRMLGELKYSFDILKTDGDFSKYRLLILPDELYVDEALSAKLSAYLAEGGRILSSGKAGLSPDGTGFALPEWDFAYAGEDEREVSFYTLTFEEPGVAPMRYDTYGRSILLSHAEGDTVLAHHVTSYFDHGYDGAHHYFYVPPKAETGYDAALINAKGNVAHVAFPVFSAYMRTLSLPHRALIKRILSLLLPDKLILAEELPTTARATVTAGDGYALLHVKVTYPEMRGRYGIIEEHNVLPEGRHVCVKGEYRSACVLPEKTPVSVEVKEGYTRLSLPEITGYAMILLQ